jgi:hypothetical protein
MKKKKEDVEEEDEDEEEEEEEEKEEEEEEDYEEEESGSGLQPPASEEMASTTDRSLDKSEPETRGESRGESSQPREEYPWLILQEYLYKGYNGLPFTNLLEMCKQWIFTVNELIYELILCLTNYCMYEVCPDDFRKIAIKKNSYSCDILYF